MARRAMQFIAKVLLALALASPTLAIPSRTILVDPLPVIEESIVIPPALIAIAKCESGNRQFDKDGNVIRGVLNPYDIGKFQINELYHGEKALSLGYDIFTEEGNTKMALWLYEHSGTSPWNWSKPCWGKMI